MDVIEKNVHFLARGVNHAHLNENLSFDTGIFGKPFVVEFQESTGEFIHMQLSHQMILPNPSSFIVVFNEDGYRILMSEKNSCSEIITKSLTDYDVFIKHSKRAFDFLRQCDAFSKKLEEAMKRNGSDIHLISQVISQVDDGFLKVKYTFYKKKWFAEFVLATMVFTKQYGDPKPVVVLNVDALIGKANIKKQMMDAKNENEHLLEGIEFVLI